MLRARIVIACLREADGRMVFEVSGVATPLVIAPAASAPAAYKQLKSAVDAKSSAVFEIVGTVEKKADVEEIVVASVKESR